MSRGSAALRAAATRRPDDAQPESEKATRLPGSQSDPAFLNMRGLENMNETHFNQDFKDQLKPKNQTKESSVSSLLLIN